MNVNEMDDLKQTVGRVLWPEPHRRGPMAAARRVAGVATVVGTLVQVVVWLMIGVLSGGLDSPWWLFSTVGCGVVSASLWILDQYGAGLGLRHEGGEVR